MSNSRRSTVHAAVVLSLLATACAGSRPSPATPSPSQDEIVIDGTAVPVAAHSVLDLMRARLSPSTLRAFSAQPGDEPLLVINGVQVAATVETLANLGAKDVAEVTTLNRNEAYQRFGRRGYNGAIIVRMRGS